ncbi:hypothetical protein GJ496_001680 [Pomphorhynchus laevis]|nr:hypothetical protein GJ496_001680 [Pomphorhynchus laevis]
MALKQQHLCTEKNEIGGYLSNDISQIYKEIIHWIPNLFNLLQCSASKNFVRLTSEIPREFNTFEKRNDNTIKRLTVLFQIVLQRINTRKISSIRKTIERRIEMWNEGNLDEIITEARYHQAKRLVQMNGLTSKRGKYAARVAKFTRMGWIGKASRLLMNENSEASLVYLDHMIRNYCARKISIPPAKGEHVHTECGYERHCTTVYNTTNRDSMN